MNTLKPIGGRAGKADSVQDRGGQGQTRGEQPEPLLLRPTEAARLLGISRSKLYELLNSGSIPVVRIGRSTRIPTAALKAWIGDKLSQG